MAVGRYLVALAVLAAVAGDYHHEVQTENKAKKAVEAEKEQKPRSAAPGRDRGSLQKIHVLMNKTEDRKGSRRRGNVNLTLLQQLNQKNRHSKPQNDMMSDNDSAIAISQKTIPDNDSDPNSLNQKIKVLRREGTLPAIYDALNTKTNTKPHVTGGFCDFEPVGNGTDIDMCRWSWNTTTSSRGLGFEVVSAADIVAMNASSKDFKFSGPTTDADDNPDGHFLYLPVDSTMDNMVIKSPAFRGLWEFCRFEAYLHQSKMENASIKLVSESTATDVQWILQEVAGNNFEMWIPMRFTVGKMQQEIRVIIEITRPVPSVLSRTLPHVAVDNVRMVDCQPEAPAGSGQCQPGQFKCNIGGAESCLKLLQVCDLVIDCDDDSDENQNCDKMPYGSYCNFEHDQCGFENLPRPKLHWSRHSGPTPTDFTGPNNDHTCGPPEAYPTAKAPPIGYHRINYTMIGQCVGYYMFVNMNASGSDAGVGFASTAVMRTAVFNPPPRVHGNASSKYYNSCMIRFYYQQNGRNYGSLGVDLVQLTPRGNISTSLWFSTKDKGEHWLRAVMFLPNVTMRYYLQFRTRMGMRIYSDSAIDDFSMAPECFGLNIDPGELGDYNYYDAYKEDDMNPHPAFADKHVYRFTTCGQTGRYGPNQTMCDDAYKGTGVSVSVLKQAPFEGVQVWEVPEEGLYTVIAWGASGGLGAWWTGVSHAAAARAVLELRRGERLHLLVGQQGSSACKKTLAAAEGQECPWKPTAEGVYTSKTHEVRNTELRDGGGGGGGGTYVFLVDKDNKTIPLIAAGGGGGISVGIYYDDGSQHGKGHSNSTPESGWMREDPGKTSGAGGGWSTRHDVSNTAIGSAVSLGAMGGRACVGEAHGGFGGGGGGCLRGGGGGGWIGGNANENEGLHGGGGWSYVAAVRAVRAFSETALAQRAGPGEVLIIPAIHDCGCDYRCVALNEFRNAVRCYCPAAWSADERDQTKCILEDSWPRISWVLILVLSGAVFVFATAVLCVCLYLYNTYQRKKETELRQKHLLEQEVQLHRLRNAPNSENPLSTMAFNPHYGSESILPQGIDVRGLPQVSRESLKLVKALGQGAFGEVYQGLYRHRTGDTVEMPVAVKTLPELSTGQAESDFLMEAAIMAKFNHPNIVHLIGVCFDRHPRFIVLELLAGGDLKNFLRESRPKPERASALTMKDLLLCSLDVCKGCRYLEAKRFIHRDIAARNCLLTSRGPGRVVKIADFGMARDIYRSDYYKKGGKAMLPIKWMPPEAYIDGVFTIKTDVWSFGVLTWEVFSLGVMPYTGCANREVMEMVSGGGRLEKPYGCPQEIYRLMCECWNPTPNDRPTFIHIFDRLQRFLQDPEIVSAPLPVVRSLLGPTTEIHATANGPQRPPAGDYLVPMAPRDASPPEHSSMDQLVPRHSTTPAAAQSLEMEDSPYPPRLKASQEYGNILAGRAGSRRDGASAASAAAETKCTIKFLPSNSTDRLLDGASMDEDTASEADERPAVWETSFSEARRDGPPVDKLISITPTSPKPPENALSKAIEANVIDKTNHKNTLVPERKTAPIASPDPPRINAWATDKPPKLAPKPKPLCLDAAQLEQNLNALKKNSGSVNLNTMNIHSLPPPYINVVTPNKFSEAKTIQIDPKKAVIHDLQSPKDATEKPKEEKTKLKQSNSTGSLLNGPMTDVPYADSDNASSSSGSNAQNLLNNEKNKTYDVGNDNRSKKILKQGSIGGKDAEISC